jgi:hypothetical protein
VPRCRLRRSGHLAAGVPTAQSPEDQGLGTRSDRAHLPRRRQAQRMVWLREGGVPFVWRCGLYCQCGLGGYY